MSFFELELSLSSKVQILKTNPLNLTQRRLLGLGGLV